MSEASDPVTIALTGQLAFVLITSALLAFLLSLACLAVYKEGSHQRDAAARLRFRCPPDPRADN